jgi:hypothetical protein
MKNTLIRAVLCLTIVGFYSTAVAQTENLNLVHITKLKTQMPEDGSFAERDSLIAIYNANVVNKNDLILSHREYGHFFTADSQDYLVIEEYKDFSAWEEAVKKTEELIEAAWPDEGKRKAFMDSMDKYFKDWHGDMLMRTNSDLSKN